MAQPDNAIQALWKAVARGEPDPQNPEERVVEVDAGANQKADR
jgi:hypothetical protein